MINNNIQSALERLGLSAQKRAIHIQFSNAALNQQLYLQRIDGEHGLNQGVQAELLCLSTNAHIPLKQFIGSQVAVDSITDRGQFFRTTGLITGAEQGQSDGALTIYKLQLQDPTALWKHRRNSRVFMGKSAVEIIEVVFKEWQQKSPIFAASLALDLSGLTKDYDVRPFVMQHNETDDEFLKRLMRQEGINFLIDEAQLFVDHPLAPIEAQKLRLIDDNAQFQSLARHNIRYHRSDATEQQDSIHSFVAQRTIQPTAVHVQRWQADALEQEEGAGSVLSHHQHSDSQDNPSLSLEQAWHFSPAWMQDLKGEDQATLSGNAQIERFNQNLANYYDAEAKQFIAQSSVRDAQVGYWFALDGHPEIDSHDGSDKEFLITSKSFYNQNNLPKDLTDQISTLLKQSNWSEKDLSQQQERQANKLTLQRRAITAVPEYNPLKHRPAAHPQRAKVVGPAGEEIHVDEWGRIKVRFMFTRSEDHGHDGGAGANDNDTDSAWIDVLTPWAGEGFGARFLPRIGEIVVVDFFDGNIDRPFVVGRIHEGQRSPTKFDMKGQLPGTKKLSGIRSKEIAGEGFGQLRFDDTTGQISSQLQSSHGVSQLNLGKLSHPKDSEKSDDRGEGFELRTDQWGAVRAGDGLLISTYKQDQAQGEHLHAEDAKKQFEASKSSSKALSDVAKNQQTDEIESVEGLQALAERIESGIAKFTEAMLLLNSPQGIALSTPENIHLSADGQINHSAGDSINLSTQKNLIVHALNRISLFAAQQGMKLVAAKGPVEIQAQDDLLSILARAGISIISTEDKIEISSPKEIVLTGSSSQITLNGSGVFPKPIKRVIKINSAAVRQGQLPGLDQIPYIIKVDVGIYAPFHVIAEEVGKRQEAERHKTQYHQIRSGETLDGIAKYYKRDISLLMKNNNITNKNDIKAGTKLYVGEKILKPEPTPVTTVGKVIKHKVKSGDTLSSIAKKYNVTVAHIAILNGMSMDDRSKIKIGDELNVKWTGTGGLIEKALKQEQEINKVRIVEKASYEKGLPINTVSKFENQADIYALSISANLFFKFNGSIDIGFAKDRYEDWMIYVAPGTSAGVNAKDINLHSGSQEKHEKAKEDGKRDINLSINGIKQNVNIVNLSDLTGYAYSHTQTLSIGPANGALTNTSAIVEDESGEVRNVLGKGTEIGFEFNGRKLKKVADGKLVDHEQSMGRSYTIPLLLKSEENNRKIFLKGESIIISDPNEEK